MASGSDSSSDLGSQDPYANLGLNPGASFDDVQKAKERRLNEVGEDPLAKARIEASYDALLMISLKERQLGRVSNAAANASKREGNISNSRVGEGDSLLAGLKGINIFNNDNSNKGFSPDLFLPEGQGLTIRIALGLLSLVLLLSSPKESIQIILSLSTLSLFISQVRRGRKPIPSLGWSIALLSIGLLIGGLLVVGISDSSLSAIPLSKEHFEALPAVILVWLGALLLG